MAVVDRRGCDGCGRSLPVEDLVAVSLPGDERAVCCPDCRKHAESIASEPSAIARQRGECEGCGAALPVDEFETVAVAGDESVAVCPECREHVAAISRRTSVDGHRGACSGCDETFDVNEMEAVELDDGTTVACCETCAEYARAAARTTADEPDFDRVDDTSSTEAASTTEDATSTDEASVSSRESRDRDRTRGDPTERSTDATAAGTGSIAEPDSVDGVEAEGEETALVETPSVCDQCGDWVEVELYEVVTVADRVEEFCPPCKDRARRNGVVTDVRMRRAQAYRVLGVEPDRAEAVVRDAYLSRIKEVHPDSDGGSRDAFRRVQRAYERLTD
jgi:hypothetical protein